MIPPSTYQGALGKAGAASGFGLGNLLGGVSDVLSAPRHMAWDALGLGENGSDLVQNLFQGGIDPESLTGQVLGNGAEMVLDPLNLLMMGGGGLLGKAAGKGLDISKGVAATRSGLAEKLAQLGAEKGAIGEASGLAKGIQTAPELMQNWPSAGSNLWKTMEGPAQSTWLEGGRPLVGKTYNRMAPEALAALEKSGMGVGRQGGGAALTMAEKPAFLKGAGGTMQLDPLEHVAEYGAKFDQPKALADVFAPGEQKLTGLANRLGESADMLHAPIGDLGGMAERRFGNIAGDTDMLGGMLERANQTPQPFNIGSTPAVSEDLANVFANMSAGGVGAGLVPPLFKPGKPRTMPSNGFPQQTQEPPLSQRFAPPERLSVMPQLAPPPIINR